MLTRILRPVVTKDLRQKLATFRIPGRPLHTFDGNTRPEVVIGNNAVIFSTLASLLKHNKQYRRNIHSELRLIAPRFWIDNVHSDYDQNFWGQTVEDIPQFVRELFKALFPKQNPNTPINWQQFKALRAYSFSLLEQEFKLPIYKGKPEISKLDDKNYQFLVTEQGYQSSFTMRNNVFVYDWERDFVSDSYINPGILQTSHTVLYRFPKSEIPRTIIVLGDGESVIWLAAHFPESTIYYLSRSHELDPLEKHRKPSHKNLVFTNAIKLPYFSVDGSHYKNLVLEEVRSKNFPLASIVSFEDKDAKINIRGHFFTSTGMRPMTYTHIMPDSQVLRLADEIPKRSFSSLKNIPAGGLMDSYLRIMEATSNQVWEPTALLRGQGLLTSYMQQFLGRYGINEQDIAELPGLLSEVDDEKGKFSAMVKLYKDKVTSDPGKVAAFEQEILALYEQSKIVLTPN